MDIPNAPRFQAPQFQRSNPCRYGALMATVTVRNLPDEVHRALRVRAATHGRSTEAEIRDILESTVRPPKRLRLGTALAEPVRFE